jgi:catechol 2,3-dioxygenase-like lactoylglutathione lyase family enzyme
MDFPKGWMRRHRRGTITRSLNDSLPEERMFDHIGIKVSNMEKSRQFYVDALKPLGFSLVAEYDPFLGFGVPGKPRLWISPGTLVGTVHVAFIANDRAAVRAFYEAAMAAGARDNGAPGPRAEYHEHYYGAFVLDPDGHNIEAVCHKPE